MKEVMEQYGKAILSALAAVSILSLVFTGLKVGEAKGLPAILGAEADSPGVDYSHYKDGEQSAFVMEIERPSVVFLGREVWTGCCYKAEDLFLAKDAQGNAAKIQILKISDKTREEAAVIGDSIEFENQGVYRILIKAVDSWCGTAEKEFLVPVRRR